MADNKYNITMWQGSTYSQSIVVKDSSKEPLDLTSYTARMQIRSSYDATDVEESLSTANGEITITAAEGKLELELSAARTANIAVELCSGTKPPKTIYVYDLEIVDTSTGTVTKLLYGDVIVYGEVTR